MTDRENKEVKDRIEADTLVPKTILLRPEQVDLIEGYIKRFGRAKLWMSMSSLVRLAVDEGLEDAVSRFGNLPGWESQGGEK